MPPALQADSLLAGLSGKPRVHHTQIKSEQTATQSFLKYLEGAPERLPYFEAGPLSLSIYNPGQSHPKLVLSSAVYQPTKVDAREKSA